MKKVLLTGSNGFIGGYFVNHYRKKYKIHSFSFINDDFGSLDCTNIDIVIHLSALVHQMGGATREEYFRVNADNTLALAQKAKKSGVKQFIFMSSVKVYGEETNIPYTETTKCEPKDDYGISKLEAENALQKLEDDDFKVSIIRTPIIYGYGVKANILNLINLIKKVPILPFAHINNRRSMVYIGNLCHLVDEIIIQNKSGVFLACDDAMLSTTKLIELIAKELDRKIYLVNVPFFESLLKLVKLSFHKRLYESLEVDNLKTKEILNLKNPFNTEQGIAHMIHGERR